MDQQKISCLPYLLLAKYRIYCSAKEEIRLPLYKGAAFHGGFGCAMQSLSPYYYKILCGANGRQNPCILVPPLDSHTIYPPGNDFFFEITLIGQAMEYFPICRDAVTYLGEQLGFGDSRGKFTISRIEQFTLPETGGGKSSGCPEIEPGSSTECKRLSLHLQTNMRLKDGDSLVRFSPRFHVLFSRLLGRLNSLALFYNGGLICSRADKEALLEQALLIETHSTDLQWQDWCRFSGRQKQWMKFGGLTGKITFAGNLTPFLPYLALGEWTHVGGKTSFGLGKYQMEVGQ